MGSPSGQYSKLWFHRELTPGTKSATFGNPTGGSTYGLRLYQEEFQPRPTKTPIRYQENRGGVSFDNFDFTPGPQGVTGTLRFALRYSGVHAVMLGHVLGNLVTAGAAAVWNHIGDGGGSGRFNSLTFLHQRPINDAGTTFIETQLLGAKIGRMRLTQSVSQPFIICEMDLVAMEAQVITAVTNNSNLPPDSNGFSPNEALAYSAHIVDTAALPQPHNFAFQEMPSGPVTYPQLEEWTIELNNFPEQTGVISNQTRQSSPARGQIREVTGSFVMEQDDSIDNVEKVFGNTSADASLPFKLNWEYVNPLVAAEKLTMSVSNAYITQPERGTSGTGPQRRRYNFTALAGTISPLWPFDFVIGSTKQKPVGATLVSYGEYVTVTPSV